MSTRALSSAELEQLLSEYHFLTNDQIELVKERAERENIDLISSLLWFNFVSDEQLGRLIADHLHFPFVVLTQQMIAPEILGFIPEVVARRHQVIAFRQTKQGLDLAMTDPANIELANFFVALRKIILTVR